MSYRVMIHIELILEYLLVQQPLFHGVIVVRIAHFGALYSFYSVVTRSCCDCTHFLSSAQLDKTNRLHCTFCTFIAYALLMSDLMYLAEIKLLLIKLLFVGLFPLWEGLVVPLGPLLYVVR